MKPLSMQTLTADDRLALFLGHKDLAVLRLQEQLVESQAEVARLTAAATVRQSPPQSPAAPPVDPRAEIE